MWHRRGVQFRANLGKDPKQVAMMFDQVAERYDLMNDLLSVAQTRWWRQATGKALDVRLGDLVLDLAGGTGTSAEPFAQAGGIVFPTDISLGMLAEGRRRHPEYTFVAGDGVRLPYCDEAFDKVSISFGLRNIVDTVAALREMLRVTRPGGTMLITEFSTPTNAILRNFFRAWLGQVMPRVAQLGSNPASYAYLVESILAWPSQQELADLISAAGWRSVEWRNLSGGMVAMHRAVAL